MMLQERRLVWLSQYDIPHIVDVSLSKFDEKKNHLGDLGFEEICLSVNKQFGRPLSNAFQMLGVCQ